MIFSRLAPKKDVNEKKVILAKDYIECPICGSRLTNPESIVAGIGPYCALKQNFAEKLSRQDLKSLANKRKSVKELKEHSTVILKDNNDSFFLGTILEKDDVKIFYLDLTNFNQIFTETGDISVSFLNSLRIEMVSNLEYYSIVDKPSSPDIARQFNKFSSTYKNMLKERTELEKELTERGLTQQYIAVKSKNEMTETQKINRKELMELRDSNPERYLLLWENGSIQINTFLSRIANEDSAESKKIQEFLTQRQNPINLKLNCKIMDYGLTEAEIINGITLSNRKEEFLAIKSFIKCSRNINLILATLNKLDIIKDAKLKIKLLKEINTMIVSKVYTEEDLKKALID